MQPYYNLRVYISLFDFAMKIQVAGQSPQKTKIQYKLSWADLDSLFFHKGLIIQVMVINSNKSINKWWWRDGMYDDTTIMADMNT